MPTHGEHLGIGKLQSAEQNENHRFFAVSHRKVLVAHLVAFAVFPLSEAVFALLDATEVNVAFAHVVEQGCYDYAVARHFGFQRGVDLLHSFPYGKRRLGGVERMLHKPALSVQVVTSRRRCGEEALLLQVFNHAFHAFAAGGAQQFQKFFFSGFGIFHFICLFLYKITKKYASELMLCG